MGEITLYLVRVWPANGGFRAAVRAVDSERVEIFTAAAALAEYLDAAAHSAAEPPHRSPDKTEEHRR